MTTFTASEVRELVGTEDIIARARVDKMLRAYADRLEADEKARPVAWLEIPPGEQGDPYYPGYRFHGLTSLPFGRYDLFIRPVPASSDSTQAQPPAASVTDEMVERARSAFVQADDGSTGITDAIRAALLAAQENPNGNN